MKSLLFAAGLFGLATAACPNQCSGHGTCSGNDLCTCYSTWTGADCSQRKCAEDRAWAINNADHHAYTECSGQGVCNRQTGECECFDGFTGRACARSACPNDCSGHGVCKLLSELKTAVQYDASNWDAMRIQSCECDAGYFGPDCSSKHCPTGDDPLTLCHSDNYNQVQEVRFTLGSLTKHIMDISASSAGTYVAGTSDEMAIFNGANYGASSTWAFPTDATIGQMRISYTDSWGAVYTGHPVDVNFDIDQNQAAEQSMELSLESLPNKKVNDVKVQSVRQAVLKSDGSVNTQFVPQRAWAVTFLGDKTNSNNVGLQNALVCDSAYSCSDDGCQPKITMPFLYRYKSVPEQTAASAPFNGLAATSYTGNLDTSASFSTNKHFVRLHADSQPQMPQGIAIDTEATRLGATDFQRYDMRILVAVADGNQQDGVDNTVDNYYTKVILGHANITSANEVVGIPGTTPAGVWTSTAGASFNGFTFHGAIPTSFDKVPVPGAPGVYLSFPSRNMVADLKARWFEILVKLPHCKVTPVTAANQVHDLANFANFQTSVDANVENIECSGRGQCNRKSGMCECFEGYFGLACNRQTTLV